VVVVAEATPAAGVAGAFVEVVVVRVPVVVFVAATLPVAEAPAEAAAATLPAWASPVVAVAEAPVAAGVVVEVVVVPVRSFGLRPACWDGWGRNCCYPKKSSYRVRAPVRTLRSSAGQIASPLPRSGHTLTDAWIMHPLT
jgi:hypothetical protein